MSAFYFKIDASFYSASGCLQLHLNFAQDNLLTCSMYTEHASTDYDIDGAEKFYSIVLVRVDNIIS